MTDPAIRALTREECEQFLVRQHIGRLAYSDGRRVEIEPIHFVFDSGWLFGRTSPGAKLAALRHRPWVALETDEVHGPFDWTSVVAHGTFYIVDPDGTAEQSQRHARVLAALRRLSPDIGTPTDPASYRTELFGVHIDELSGRQATSK